MCRTTVAVVVTLLALAALAGATGGAAGAALTDGTVRIETVRPAAPGTAAGGERLVRPGLPVTVAGVTNLQPEGRLLVVEIRTAAGEFVAVGSTDDWGRDGAWRVVLADTRLSPGNYTVRAAAAGVTDFERLRVTEATPTPTEPPATPTPAATSGRTVADRSGTTAPPTPTVATVASPRQTTAVPTAGVGAGFGVGAAVGGLAAAALLAWRRRW